MHALKLTLACDDYDYLRPLREGRVRVEGIDLNLLTVESGVRHRRMSLYGEYDACEYSMGSYLVARAQDDDWLQAIPFFARRMFAHRFCFVRAGAGIATPADLRGGRVGMLGYQNSLALIVKGMLTHDHGLPLTDVTWVTTRDERVSRPPPPNVEIVRLDGARRLEDLLLAGEIDAMVEPDLPHAWLRGDGTLARLFPDCEKAERDYYERTRIFPIMHPVVVKKEMLDRDPWVATSLFEALMESKRLSRRTVSPTPRESRAARPTGRRC
jgi:4,5-dihydroxyphthalate decarboxylase